MPPRTTGWRVHGVVSPGVGAGTARGGRAAGPSASSRRSTVTASPS